MEKVVKMKKLINLSKLFNNNRFLMVFSLALAIILWFVVSIVYSPQTGRTVSQVPVEITFSEQDAGYQIYSETDLFAKVEVSGKKYEVERLGTDSFVVSATVDTVNTGGMYTLDLVARKKDGGDYTILTVSPSTINVMIDVEREATFDVGINCVGATIAALEQENENLVLEPAFADEKFSTVTVVGPDSEVRQIARVEALTEVNQELSETRRFDSRLVAYDAMGAAVYDSSGKVSKLSHLTLSYETAEVVANVNLRKTVPIKINMEHAPANPPAITLQEVAQDHSAPKVIETVSIKGDKNLINGMNEITLDGVVDFSKIKFGTADTYQFNLQLPSITGVSYDGYESLADLSGHSFVATVDLNGYATQTITVEGDSVRLANVKAGCTAKLNDSSKRITVIGPWNQVRNLTADNVVLTADLSSVAVGTTASVTPSIRFTNADGCWVVGSYSLSVDVKKK